MAITHNGQVTDLDAFTALFTDEGAALLASLREYDPAQELAVATRLRRTYPTELVSAALAQARLRQRAVPKFGADDAYRMFFTPNGVEQSTRKSVAEYRARRFAELGVRSVADLCCGIGGDATALARAGISVLAVDRDPLTAEVVRANSRRPRAEQPDRGAVHGCGGGRHGLVRRCLRRPGTAWRPRPDLQPRGVLTAAVLGCRRGGRPPGVRRVAPGSGSHQDRSRHPARDDPRQRRGRVDLRRRRRQGSGALVRHGSGARRATLLPSGATLTGRGLPNPAVRALGRYLYEPDGAVIRAHLVAEVAEELGGGLIDETIAYVTADELRPTPYARAYEITDELPFGLKKLKALLREREVGNLTVKKRGSAVEPEEVRRRVKPQGPNAATVILTRVSRRADDADRTACGPPIEPLTEPGTAIPYLWSGTLLFRRSSPSDPLPQALFGEVLSLRPSSAAPLPQARSVSSSAYTWESGCGPTYCWQLQTPGSKLSGFLFSSQDVGTSTVSWHLPCRSCLAR